MLSILLNLLDQNETTSAVAQASFGVFWACFAREALAGPEFPWVLASFVPVPEKHGVGSSV